MDPIFRDITEGEYNIEYFIIKYNIPLGSILYVNFEKREFIIVINLNNDGKYLRVKKDIDLFTTSPLKDILIRKEIKYKKLINYINSYENYNFLENSKDIEKIKNLGLYD